MNNLFSSFDQTISFFYLGMSFNWISVFVSMFFIPQTYWLFGSQMTELIISMQKSISFELSSIFSNLNMPGNNYLFLSIFIFILMTNFMGLFPYIFTNSSHLVFTLSLALPLWMGSIIWSIIMQFNNMASHLVPLGTPSGLMPVMVIIETVSNIIRPVTLSVRLAANMVAGHLLLALLGSQSMSWFTLSFIMLLLSLTLLMTLEVAVSCIQSYVFMILNSLYLKEINSAYLCVDKL